MLIDGPAGARHTFVLAHGAGGAMDTPWMTTVARAIGQRGIRVVRFEFPYMAARRNGGRRGAPDKQPVLLETWRNVVAELGEPVAIGGKSLGGRMASMVADELRVRALVCFGYPFHPPGQPDRLRTEHLRQLKTPALFLQGERDPFGSREEVSGFDLPQSITIEWMADGDHSLKPRTKAGVTEAEQLARAAELAYEFIVAH